LFKLQVGAWSFEVSALSSSPVVQGSSLSAPSDLEELLAAEERGDVDTLCPLSPERGRAPSVSVPVAPGVVDGSQPILSQPTPKAQLAKLVNGPDRLKLLFSPILKWVWRLVGTLDPTFSFSTSIQIYSVPAFLPSTPASSFSLCLSPLLSWIAAVGMTVITGMAARILSDRTTKPFR
jgi:hypothetical protein